MSINTGVRTHRVTKRARQEKEGGLSPAAAVEYFKSLAPPSHHSPEVCLAEDSYAGECVLCRSFLREPVELACGVMVCCNCCCRWVEVSNALACPCCYDHSLGRDTVTAPSSIVMGLLSNIRLKCLKCHAQLPAHAMEKHVEQDCSFDPRTPSKVSAAEILNRPLSATSQPVEKQVTEHLVRRLLSQTPDSGVATMQTRGRVSNTYISK